MDTVAFGNFFKIVGVSRKFHDILKAAAAALQAFRQPRVRVFERSHVAVISFNRQKTCTVDLG